MSASAEMIWQSLIVEDAFGGLGVVGVDVHLEELARTDDEQRVAQRHSLIQGNGHAGVRDVDQRLRQRLGALHPVAAQAVEVVLVGLGLARHAGAVELDQVSINNISRIEVIKGANSAIYGQTEPTGLRNIVTKKAIENGEVRVNGRIVPTKGGVVKADGQGRNPGLPHERRQPHPTRCRLAAKPEADAETAAPETPQ